MAGNYSELDFYCTNVIRANSSKGFLNGWEILDKTFANDLLYVASHHDSADPVLYISIFDANGGKSEVTIPNEYRINNASFRIMGNTVYLCIDGILSDAKPYCKAYSIKANSQSLELVSLDLFNQAQTFVPNVNINPEIKNYFNDQLILKNHGFFQFSNGQILALLKCDTHAIVKFPPFVYGNDRNEIYVVFIESGRKNIFTITNRNTQGEFALDLSSPEFRLEMMQYNLSEKQLIDLTIDFLNRYTNTHYKFKPSSIDSGVITMKSKKLIEPGSYSISINGSIAILSDNHQLFRVENSNYNPLVRRWEVGFAISVMVCIVILISIISCFTLCEFTKNYKWNFIRQSNGFMSYIYFLILQSALVGAVIYCWKVIFHNKAD